MVGLIAFVRPDSCVMGEEVYVRNTIITYQVFDTVTIPATVTKSIGLPADAQVVMVFASSPRQFYRDGTTSCHLLGFSSLTVTSGR